MSIAVFRVRLQAEPMAMTDAMQDPCRLAEYFAFLDAVREGDSINIFAGSVPLQKSMGSTTLRQSACSSHGRKHSIVSMRLGGERRSTSA